jgi:rubredoxin
MNRRQFIKICSAFLGSVALIFMGSQVKAEGQPEKSADDMAKYVCEICGYIYDPEKGDPSQGIQAGTPFKKLPDNWKCPICGVDKSQFKQSIF